MKNESIPSGLGQPVRPFIRILAAFIGLVNLFALGLYGYLFFIGVRDTQFELKTVGELLLLSVLAAYGVSIGIRGKAPNGVLPWR